MIAGMEAYNTASQPNSCITGPGLAPYTVRAGKTATVGSGQPSHLNLISASSSRSAAQGFPSKLAKPRPTSLNPLRS